MAVARGTARFFPLELKVDSQFVACCADHRLQQAACRRIIDLTNAVGARTVATGVERQADFLAAREIGIFIKRRALCLGSPGPKSSLPGPRCGVL